MDHTHMRKKCQIIEYIPYGQMQLFGNFSLRRPATDQHANDAQAVC
jgi:hypothetical protein